MAQATKSRIRSLSEAIHPHQYLECAPPAKRIRLQGMNQTESMTEHRNDTKFIIGCNRTEFNVMGSLFSNQSDFFRELMDCNKTNGKSTVYITDIESATFQFIVDFVYLRNPIISFKTLIDILIAALRYKILRLIQCCKHELTKINGNVDDWYRIMFALHNKAFLKPFVAHFIESNMFDDIHRLISDPRFAQLSLCSITHFITYYTEFDGEAMKLLAVYRYLQASHAHKKDIYHNIRKHFLSVLDVNALNKWANSGCVGGHNMLLIDIIQQIQSDSDLMHIQTSNYKGNQANSRKSKPRTPKTHCSNINVSDLENDNDKKKRVILRKYGFKKCNKIQASRNGSIWRAICSKSGESVVIKTALHLYKKDIMNEVRILRELNCKQMQNTSDLDIKNGIIRMMDVIEDEFMDMMILPDGGKDLFEFTTECHAVIIGGNMLISDWQKTSKLIAYKLAKIVSWLHANNVCHLDISLENILISNVKWIEGKQLNPEFVLTLIDFEAAQTLKDNKDCFEYKTRIGKPGCCSPQIFKKCPFSAKAADCWSFGVTLFTLIIGAIPWQMPDSEGNKLFQAIVLDNNMEKILKMWKRCNYLSVRMKLLLKKIFVMNEDERASMEFIKQYLQ